MVERMLSLPKALSSAACARRTVGDMLRSLGADEEEVTPVVAVVSELVVNGVTHAASDVDVVVRAEDDTVRVEVVDYGAGVPAIPALSLDADRGRGLRIVDALADRWGVHCEDAWKAVWAELHVSLRNAPREAIR